MFYGMSSHYVGYRTYDITSDDSLRDCGRHGADTTVWYFPRAGQAGAAGDPADCGAGVELPRPCRRGGPSGDVLGAVDAIHTALTVLWRAYNETGDPGYRNTAVSHADRYLDWYVRPDGRTWHHAEFDLETGDLVLQYSELAYSDEICWARGQGWCTAGLGRAFNETGAGRYLDALELTVNYYRSHTPDNHVPYWDFEHPDIPDVPRDMSAAALVVYGLTRLDQTDETTTLGAFGNEVLESLVANYLMPNYDADDRPPGMVIEGCYNGPAGFATACELVWTDYYVAVALAHRLSIVDF